MPYQAKPKDKKAYGAKLIKLIQEHKTIMLVSVDNVGSSQIQQVRIKLRDQAEILMGKNVSCFLFVCCAGKIVVVRFLV